MILSYFRHIMVRRLESLFLYGNPLKVHWRNANLQSPTDSVHLPRLLMTEKVDNELIPFEPINNFPKNKLFA